MASFKSWVSALRPRTLFLAVASAICGNAIAYSAVHLLCGNVSIHDLPVSVQFNTPVCILTILIATLLQLTSNMANDLGDYQHGTDITGERVGPTRTVQSGAITPKEMKIAIAISIGLSCIVGGLLILKALRFINIGYIILFFVLGILSIWAAIKYTAGKNPYGYRGLGDVFAFIFFGPIAVVGTFFLHIHEFTFQPWLPAIGIGFFTAAVLNVNNMRDMENDRNSGKNTLVIKLGLAKSKAYHSFLSIGGIVCFILYSIIYSSHWYEYLYMVTFLFFINILSNIYKTKDNKKLDPYLKQTSIATFILSIAFTICICI